MGEERYHILRALSRGAEGMAMVGIDSRGGASVVVDRIPRAGLHPQRAQDLEQRARWLLEARPPNILPLLELQPGRDAILLVHPRSQSSLLEHWQQLSTDQEGALRQLANQLSIDLCRAALAAHRVGLHHGALCPSNILLQDGGWCLDLSSVETGRREVDATSIDRACQPPEKTPSRAGDVYALGASLLWLFSGGAITATTWDRKPLSAAPPAVTALLEQMLQHDASKRPHLAAVAKLLTPIMATQQKPDASPPTPARAFVPEAGATLGRFKLQRPLGSGAAGCVYLATDLLSGKACALKTLLPHALADVESVRRFYREAQLLAAVDSPYIAQFIDANQQADCHYLAMEYIAGTSLAQRLADDAPLEPTVAMRIARDVASGLRDLHTHGVIHRDVKPANILIHDEPNGGGLAKLCDLGIAYQQYGQVESQLTVAGITVGTPHYMSPEQCSMSRVDARSDLYSLGVVLFAMLSGDLPFHGGDAATVIEKKLSTTPPPLRALRPTLGSGLVELVERLLRKNPNERYATATALIDDLNALLHGQPTAANTRPLRPLDDTKTKTFVLELELESSPTELWPHVSNTDRLNHAIHLSSVSYTQTRQDNQTTTQAEVRQAGFTLKWTEHPFEWVAPSRLGVLREFQQGPVIWLRNIVELNQYEGRTRLRHSIEVKPHSRTGSFLVMNELALRVRPRLNETYRHLDQFIQQQKIQSQSAPQAALAIASGDPLTTGHEPDKRERAFLRSAKQRLIDDDFSPETVYPFLDYIAHAPAQVIARIQPKVLASKLGILSEKLFELCLQATSRGILFMFWDVLCPVCRTTTAQHENLATLRKHTDCAGCGSSFELSFADSVEVIFRPTTDFRKSEFRTYCIGGPAHTPHVVAQLRLEAGEHVALTTMLSPGEYRLSGRGLRQAWLFVVDDASTQRRLDISLRNGLEMRNKRSLASKQQSIMLRNDFGQPILVRLEVAHARQQSWTAAEASAHPAFQRLFPNQLLQPDQLVCAGKVFLLAVQADELWAPGTSDGAAFAQMHRLKQSLTAAFREDGGVVHSFNSDEIIIRFKDATSLARSALMMRELNLGPIRSAAHSGKAMIAGSQQQLLLFGAIMRDLKELLTVANPFEVVLSEEVWSGSDEALQLQAAQYHVGIAVLERTLGHRVALNDPQTHNR
jgi:eukaryotic-like serine/threonine-protein kinase